MKTFLYTFILTIIIVSCNTQEDKVDYTILKGKVLNSDNNTIRIRSLNGSFSKSITLTNEGTFVDTLTVKDLNYVLQAGKGFAYLYLEPGYDLNISLDAKDYNNTLKFNGKGSEVNSYLFTKKIREAELKAEKGNLYNLNETEFVNSQRYIKTGLIELLSNYKGLPETYKKFEKRNLNYLYLNNLNSYEQYHAYYTKNKDFKVSENFLNELDEVNYENQEDFKFSYAYSNLVSSYYNKVAKTIQETDSLAYDIALLKALNTAKNETIKNQLLYKNAKYGITYTRDLDTYFKTFKAGSTNKEHIKEITESYTVLKTVDKGNPSPKFIDYENYKGGTTSLDDLKGSYVYIDVWATWCGPCKAEIPYLKEIEKKYHDKNIEFVSISVDKAKDHDKWKKMVTEKNLGGIQLMADNDFNSTFVKDYFIKGIPKFILLDPKGIILNSNAPRPSNKDLTKLFDQLHL